MTRKKIILCVILLIIALWLSTMFYSFSFVSHNPNTEYEYIMKDIITNYDAKITDVAMLGAHDAFTSGINLKSKVEKNDNGLGVISLIAPYVKGVFIRTCKTQNADATELLYAGVRYLDVRVSKVDGIYYAYHNFLSETLEYYFKEVVDFLYTHQGEVVILDIQHFATENGMNLDLETTSDWEDLISFIETIKAEDGTSILDYARYSKSSNSIGELTYGTLTENGTTAGVVIMGKTSVSDKVYLRDPDASWDDASATTIRSYWHNVTLDSEILEGIEKEYNYVIDNNIDGVFVVNQGQKTALSMSISIISGLSQWSLMDMASGLNKKYTNDKERFMRWLSAMPILMVDYSTSNSGDFNKLANEYIMEYNANL